MKKNLLLVLALFNCAIINSQSSSDAAVQVMASVQNSPAQITLTWPTNATSNQYQVYRKLKSSLSWGAPLATLSGSTTQYADASVSSGVSYEYRITRQGNNYTGYGYINSGVNVPAIENRGVLILLIDSTFITPLASEINRLIKDIEGDGWDIRRHDVDRGGSVYHVKDFILNDFNVDSFNLKAVFILGHVPVPYSGNINPDGHGDHLGAWPADCYYGDVDGTWTDSFVTSTTASPARTQNIPGDGKFDQSIIPSDMELQVGRVDFANMPAFTASEEQLLKNYLDKDHDYRKKIYVPLRRAVVDDNFGYFSSEAFAASGYKNFGPLVGSASVTVADYFTSMGAGSYQWSFGCGGGTYISAGGIGNTGNFASSNLQGVFTMLFGSYFGDWDSQNNFLRAPLAQGKVLTNVWSGRPHYQFHHMGLGENIGYGIIMTQNNPGNLYYASPTNITGRWIHNALMGDPTLRQDIVAPVSNVVATKAGNNCHISWTPSTQTNVIGYNIYVKNDSIMSYQKINQTPVSGTTYTDLCLPYLGIYHYMVRALVLENNFSGSYYNQSEGIADTAFNSLNYASASAFTYSLAGNVLSLFNQSTVPATYQWDFGNGASSTAANPVVTYSANGFYQISLIGTNACYTDTSYQYISITEVGFKSNKNSAEFRVYPNPSNGVFLVEFPSAESRSISVCDIRGAVVFSSETSLNKLQINLHELNKGFYVLSVKTPGNSYFKKILLH